MASDDATRIFEAMTFGRVALYSQLGETRARVNAFQAYWVSMRLSISAYKAALSMLRQEANDSRKAMPTVLGLKKSGEIVDDIINAIDSELLYWNDTSGTVSR